MNRLLRCRAPLGLLVLLAALLSGCQTTGSTTKANNTTAGSGASHDGY